MEMRNSKSIKNLFVKLILSDECFSLSENSKPKPKSKDNKYIKNNLIQKCIVESESKMIPGYCISDFKEHKQSQQNNGLKDGSGIKYTLNIISDNNPDLVTQAHSPRIEADNSPTGLKKPNYLMKSIFCDCKTPSPKTKSNQRSPSQYLNISPIQQYFDLASRKKNNDSYHDLNEKNNNMFTKSNDSSPKAKELEGNDNKYNFGDFDNNHFGFSKQKSYELWSNNLNELDHSINSGSNNLSPMINSNDMKGYSQVQQDTYNQSSSNHNNDLKYNYIKKMTSQCNTTTPNPTIIPNISKEPNYMNMDKNQSNTTNCNQSNIGPNYNFNIMVIKNNYDDGYIQQQQNQYKKYYSIPMNQPIQQQNIPPYNMIPHTEKYLNLGYKPMNQNLFPQHHQQQHNTHLNLNNFSMNQKNQYPIQNQQYQMNNSDNNSNLYQYQQLNVNPTPQYSNINNPMPTSPHKSINPQQQFYPTKPSPNPIKPIPMDDPNQAYLLAKDQSGCRFLQKKIDEDPDKAIETVYPIILEHLIELTTEQFGNYLIQKFLEYLDEQRLIQFMGIISPYTNSIGLNPYGTRVIQKLMDRINSEKLINSFIIILTPNILPFIKDTNGIHIMQKLILMPNITFDFLFEIVCPNISELSTHRIGCCFVQKCFHAIKDNTLGYLLDEIIKNTMTLVTNQYGNYVIQNVMLLNDLKRNRRIFDIMMSNFCAFSKHKFASNVIEKFFEYDELRELLIDNLLYPEAIKLLLFDNFGNYVLQKGLSVSNNEKRKQMLYLIAPLLDQLKMVNFGQKLYHKLIVQYPNLSTIMFSLKNNNRMNVFIGKKDMNNFNDN